MSSVDPKALKSSATPTRPRIKGPINRNQASIATLELRSRAAPVRSRVRSQIEMRGGANPPLSQMPPSRGLSRSIECCTMHACENGSV